MFRAQPALLSSLPGAAGWLALLVTAVPLAANVASPGCTGPPARQPCDFVELFKSATFVDYRRTFAIRVADLGSSVYVNQPLLPQFLSHEPGVLIDKRSCRVCRVDGYAMLLDYPEPPFDPPIRVLAWHPPEDRCRYGELFREAEIYAREPWMRRALAFTPRWHEGPGSEASGQDCQRQPDAVPEPLPLSPYPLP